MFYPCSSVRVSAIIQLLLQFLSHQSEALRNYCRHNEDVHDYMFLNCKKVSSNKITAFFY